MKKLIGLIVLVCGLVGYPCLSFSQIISADIVITPSAYSGVFGGFAGGDGDTGTSTYIDWSIGNTVPFGSVTNGMVFSTCTGDFMTSSNWEERMRITKVGNVGIGTVNPDEKLEVKGNIKINRSGNGIIFPDGTVQTTASAPTWHQLLPASERFKLVMNSEAVLDRETGLVWEKNPSATSLGTTSWASACNHCYPRQVGGRKGWRLPTIEELASLVDTSNFNPALPTGHLFINVQSHYYWSSSTDVSDASYAWVVDFANGYVASNGKSVEYNHYVWCVRGGYGHDAY